MPPPADPRIAAGTPAPSPPLPPPPTVAAQPRPQTPAHDSCLYLAAGRPRLLCQTSAGELLDLDCDFGAAAAQGFDAEFRKRWAYYRGAECQFGDYKGTRWTFETEFNTQLFALLKLNPALQMRTRDDHQRILNAYRRPQNPPLQPSKLPAPTLWPPAPPPLKGAGAPAPPFPPPLVPGTKLDGTLTVPPAAVPELALAPPPTSITAAPPTTVTELPPPFEAGAPPAPTTIRSGTSCTPWKYASAPPPPVGAQAGGVQVVVPIEVKGRVPEVSQGVEGEEVVVEVEQAGLGARGEEDTQSFDSSVEVFRMSCDIFPGQSGSPFWAQTNDSRSIVVGTVDFQNDAGFNGGKVLTKGVWDFIYQIYPDPDTAPANPCTVQNGGCASLATCSTPAGKVECTCPASAPGDGWGRGCQPPLGSYSDCGSGRTCCSAPWRTKINATIDDCIATCAGPGPCYTISYDPATALCRMFAANCGDNRWTAAPPGTLFGAAGPSNCPTTAGCAPNPCLTNNGGCHAQANCTNSNGAARCACRIGWTGNGRTCTRNPDTRIQVSAASVNCGSRVTLRATLTRADNRRAIAGQQLAFRIGGADVGRAATNGQGVATFGYAAPGTLGKGRQTITVRYAGSSSYNSASATGTLTVS
ncbi:hypothetical protein DFJ74DRAFT_740086 [Hyaloraphidium curvatum]|nr:hypothetical protein DFJ74DRAFT_740086 [Hyaloraphidium curvatum]